LSAKVEVQLGHRHDVLAIPTGAVSVDHDRNVCYVLGPSGPVRREITPGASNPDLIEVVEGLREGESVVLNPNEALAGPDSRSDSASPDQRETDAFAALR
jgi:multidrug efflux pump subunit AcrA (membrane-fusion protein)